ncbi:MAG: alanyl-tRNA editing protein [Thermoplasmata archaeon]|nr:alanyl-tRNA editing protein [Thermoplasmata archaeon]
MTELAYLADEPAGYTRQFSARVVALPPGGVVLDRTFFYPVGGGQPADHGSLALRNGVPYPVVDVTKSGTSAVHRVRRPTSAPFPWKAGDEVEGMIDWDRRYRHMRLHTGQHLLSALIFQRTGIRTQEATMSGAGGTIDLERPIPPGTRPEALASEANSILREGRRVSIHHVSREAWEKNPSPRSGLVSLPRQVDPVRIIEIAGLDACPCGGTHVRSTLEVGDLSLDPAVPIALGAVRMPFRLVDAMRPTRSG